MNWAKVDDSWVNFDNFSDIYIRYFKDINQYEIHAYIIPIKDQRDEKQIQLFKKCFRDRENAQDYLDEFMTRNFRNS